MSHTQTPWFIDGAGDVCSGALAIAIMPGCREAEEEAANAHVIMEAPNLLRHLIGAVDALEAFGIRGGGIPEMKQCIARAKRDGGNDG